MDNLIGQSKTTILYQVNFLVAQGGVIDETTSLQLQKALVDEGLTFNKTEQSGGRILLRRDEPSKLQIVLESPGQGVNSLSITAPNAAFEIETFIRQGQAGVRGYQEVFANERYQVLRTGAKVQQLYSTNTHAFKYIWEGRLGRSKDDFGALGGRPVAGGGVRLVLPPQQGQERPDAIEIRIESYFKEPSKVFVETGLTHPQPMMMDRQAGFGLEGILKKLDGYASNEVWQFLSGGQG
jgi:hypothetical protein